MIWFLYFVLGWVVGSGFCVELNGWVDGWGEVGLVLVLVWVEVGVWLFCFMI